jgi:hypothetical protein
MLYDLILVGLIGDPLDLTLFRNVNGTSFFNWPTTGGGYAGTFEDAYGEEPIDQVHIYILWHSSCGKKERPLPRV